MPQDQVVSVRERASEWARAKLAAEAAEKAATEGPGVRQFTVRMPAEDLALVDAVAKRYGISRNQAFNIFVTSACGDAYEVLPYEDRVKILSAVSAALGFEVKAPQWLRKRDFTQAEEQGVPPDVIDGWRYGP